MITCTGCGAVITTEPHTGGIGAGHVCPALLSPAAPRIRIEDHIVWKPAPASVEPYTDPCVKCGSTVARTSFHANDRDCSYPSRSKPRGEHLHHWCQGCHFDWTERTREARMKEAELRSKIAEAA